jgi:hypothetical protein
MRFPRRVVPGVASCLLAAVSAAQQPIAYPERGQSPRQQEQDTVQCQAWARRAVGAGSAAAGASESRPASGDELRGALAGARAGSAAGGISDPAGEAAAAGAALGPMAGERQRARRQAPGPAAGLDRAFADCMSGRGYSIR